MKNIFASPNSPIHCACFNFAKHRSAGGAWPSSGTSSPISLTGGSSQSPWYSGQPSRVSYSSKKYWVFFVKTWVQILIRLRFTVFTRQIKSWACDFASKKLERAIFVQRVLCVLQQNVHPTCLVMEATVTGPRQLDFFFRDRFWQKKGIAHTSNPRRKKNQVFAYCKLSKKSFQFTGKNRAIILWSTKNIL